MSFALLFLVVPSLKHAPENANQISESLFSYLLIALLP